MILPQILLLFLIKTSFFMNYVNGQKKVKCEVLPPRILDNSTLQNNTDLAKEVDGILTEGGKQLVLKNHSKRAILILGNTGSGKTTVSLIMNGDLSTLHSKKTKSGKLVIIDDGDKIGLPSTKSRTLIPEYIVSPSTQAAFYDCPGFDDNRGPAEDIAAMYFVKSILDQLQQVKFLFTIPFNSLQLGGDRNDFDLLTKHASILLQNMTKFNNSIGLIVTKVPNFDNDGEPTLEDDLIEGFLEFFLDYVNVLKDKIRKSKISELAYKERLQRQLEFVQTILAENGKCKLRFVRNPPQCSPFSQMPRQLELRYNIINFYNNSLKYTDVTQSDFGLTLKDTTKLTLNEEVLPAIQKAIEDQSSLSLENLKQRYFIHFNSSMNGTDNERIEAISNLQIHQLRVSSLLQEPSFKEKRLSQKVSELYDSAGGTAHDAYLNEVEKKEDWLNFFRNITSLNYSKAKRDNSHFELFNAELIDNFHKAKDQIVQVYIPRLTSLIEADTKAVLLTAGESYIKSYIEQLTTFPVESYAAIKKGRVFIRNYQISSNASAISVLENVVDYFIQNSFSTSQMDLQMMDLMERVENNEITLMSYLELSDLPSNSTSSLIKNGIFGVTQIFQNGMERARSYLINELMPEKVAKIEEWIKIFVENLWIDYFALAKERLGGDDTSRINTIKAIKNHYDQLYISQEEFEGNSLANTMKMLASLMGKSISQITLSNINYEENILNQVRLEVGLDPEPISIQDTFSRLLLNFTILQKDSQMNSSIWRLSRLDQVKIEARLNLRSDFTKRFSTLRKGLSYITMSNYITSLQSEIDAKDFGKIDVDDEILQSYDELLGRVDSKKVLNDVVTEEMMEIKKRLKDQLNWYTFLVELKKNLTFYDIQMKLDRVKSSEHFSLLKSDPLTFLNSTKMVVVPLKVFSQVKHGGNADEVDLNILEQVINYATEVKTEVECGMVSGRFVKLSEFQGCFLESSLTIFASDTLYFDKDIVANGARININAKKWVVVGQRMINVDGADGIDNSGKAQQEQDGLGGGPGATGGSFVGDYDEIENDSKLTITANGGRGGNGQDGGDGRNGKDGKAAKYSEFPSAYKCTYDNPYNPKSRFKYVRASMHHYGVYAYMSYRMHGHPGTNGTNGGNGGKAGDGGNPGHIKINKEGLINTSAVKGSDGKMGYGGKGGTGGYNGNHHKCVCRGAWPAVQWWDSCETELVHTRASNGNNGINGGSSRDS